MTRVYVDMVGDLFHFGHVEFLRQSRSLGDELLVGVHSDETVTSYKRVPLLAMVERIRVVEACRWVDEVIADAPLEVDRAWIRRYEIDIVVHGDDFDEEERMRFYKAPIEMGIFRTVPYTVGTSTSEILDRVKLQLASER